MSKCRNLIATTALATLAAAPVLAQEFGLGRAALPEEIEAWDVAVLPDGTGLPEGSGDVYDGEEAWINNCASCHGDFAEGAGAWPVIAGGDGTLTDARPVKTVGSYWPYLSTVFDYVHRSMPFGAAQILTYDETYAITAYILYSNGIVDDDFVLSRDNFTEVNMPNVDGFIVDDRVDTEFPLFVTEPCMSDCTDSVEISKRASDIAVTPPFPRLLLDGTVLEPGETLEEASMQGSATDAAPVEEAAAEPAAEEVEVASVDPALIEAGESAFRQCRSCHQVGDGARSGVGPALNGVVGSVVGQVDGFRYSPAFAEKADEGMVWTAEALDAFLENPRDYIERNRMAFRGVQDADERAALIAYLGTYPN
ncbi:MAG: sulfur dehydrogenase diheme cytochrome c subunit SoxD [Roseibaca calidilacus]|uniref:Sulfur dehydrogenase diheme cytochrome c subunit SoxD n=1 Tax=Roseibaca calidilacus TaxID=1666912 RepID=A0A0P7YMB9_9RHOB|nr:c-type cytochrome [Roseibaca calidilacus]KPP91637.1 MAG: sulfur dehydrogenase diheme cytochrome c subunit SoxD [Roseibaca calidilacus]CUX82776.1 sulfur dehydrogenase subunit SoxD [Roseibaca calidilacus]